MISCELCKSKKTKLMFNYTYSSYYFCSSCCTLYLYPKPNLKRLKKYYKSEFDYKLTSLQKSRLKKRAKLILNRLLKINPKGKKLLDIGSGRGYLLKESKKRNIEAIGLEPSKSLYEYAQTQHLPSINSTFEEYYKSIKDNKKFDFITMIHVLEHVANPESVVKKALKLLNKDGVLFIETPNLKSHLFHFESSNYTFLLPKEHLWIFSLKSFQKMISKLSNAKMLFVSCYSYPEHFMGIIKNIFYRNNLSKQYNISRSCNLSSDKTNLFKKLKYLLFDQILAHLVYWILNLFNYGSFLELCIKKIK